MAFLVCFLFFFLISSATACDRCVHQSKVAYFNKASALSCKIYNASLLFFFLFFLFCLAVLINNTQMIFSSWKAKIGIDPDDIFVK
jgi:hypothetical protein